MKQIIEIEMFGQNFKGTPEHLDLLRLAAIQNKNKLLSEQPVKIPTGHTNFFDQTKWSRKERKCLKNGMQNSIFIESGLTDELKVIIQKDLLEYCKKNRSLGAITSQIQHLKPKRIKKTSSPKWTITELDKAVDLYKLHYKFRFIASELFRLKLSPVLRSRDAVSQRVYDHTTFRRYPGGLSQFRKNNKGE